MVVGALFGLLHLAVVVCATLAMGRSLLIQRRSIRLSRFVLVAVLCSAGIAVVSYPVAERIYRWRHPLDDWFDIAAGGALLANICAIPLVVIVVIVMGRLLDSIRRSRFAFCCDTCGYDLRGGTGGACPECGAAPKTRHG